ncbi:MAG TPA: type I methionyl aminopeptidase [Candidatus Saccharimonadales bacterium]|nr:type I methionyl aminopeptidase [Candidatus Saccharimonadales bacterium]
MIFCKTWSEIQTMNRANGIVLDVLARLREIVAPGVTTLDLDRKAEEWTRQAGAVPAFKGYRGYPASLCVAPNDVIVHGIPDGTVLEAGDIVGLDYGVIVDGFYGDSAITVPVGEVTPEASQLMDVTEKSLYAGIGEAVIGHRVQDIGFNVQRIAERAGYSVVLEFTGHGIGRRLHEDPQVPNYGKPGLGEKLEEGMVLAIEPMLCAGGNEVVVDDDQWTARTADGKLAAHFERSVALTPDGPWILGEGKAPGEAARRAG